MILKPKKVGPFELEVGDEPEIIKNPISGDSIECCPEAVALYDLIQGAEFMKDYDTVDKGLYYFGKTWPKEYMVLLD